MFSAIADAVLGIKDFLVGSVSGVLNGPYRWASAVWPFTLVLGIGAGLATGNAAILVGTVLGGPLLAGLAGGVLGLLGGGIGEVASGLKERHHNRAVDDKIRDQQKAKTQAVAPAPAAPSSHHAALHEVPSTEIMAPGATPQRLAEAEKTVGRS